MAYFRKRGKKWYYTLEVGDAHGKRKKVERPGGLTKADCERAYRAAMAEVDQTGEYSAPSNITVEEFFTEWLKEYVEVNLKYNTIRTYKSIVQLHIFPTIGAMKMRRVTRHILQNLLNEKKEGHARRTVIGICNALKKGFAYACDISEYIKSNPAIAIRVPNYIEAPKEISVFTPAQVETLLKEYPPGHRFYMAIVLSYHTGMRLGECLALKWEDVDLEAHSLFVRHTVIGKRESPRFQEIPKTKSSIREIPFGRKLYKILKSERARQAARRLEYGEHYNNNGVVCSWPDGSIMLPNDFQAFNLFCKKAFGAGSFHGLRHTHATMLLEAGEDLELVSKRLGHSNIGTTSKTYSHILDKRKAKTVALLDEIL